MALFLFSYMSISCCSKSPLSSFSKRSIFFFFSSRELCLHHSTWPWWPCPPQPVREPMTPGELDCISLAFRSIKISKYMLWKQLMQSSMLQTPVRMSFFWLRWSNFASPFPRAHSVPLQFSSLLSSIPWINSSSAYARQSRLLLLTLL